MRRPVFAAFALLALLAGGAAGPARAETADVAGARAWQGRWCGPSGCQPQPRASLASVACFGAAALGAGLISRRRSA